MSCNLCTGATTTAASASAGCVDNSTRLVVSGNFKLRSFLVFQYIKVECLVFQLRHMVDERILYEHDVHYGTEEDVLRQDL